MRCNELKNTSISLFGIGLLLFCAPAYAYIGGSLGIPLGLIIGIVAGIVGGVLIAKKETGTAAKKILIGIPIIALSAGLGGVFGAVIGGSVEAAAALTYVHYKTYESNEGQALPLNRAACGDDVGKVRELVSRPLDKATKKHLANITFHCVLFTNPRRSNESEMFNAIAPVLHAQYREENDFKKIKNGVKDYCGLLDLLIGRLSVDKLKALQKMGLPLHCRDGKARPALELFAEYARDPKTVFARRSEIQEVLGLIGGRNGLIKDAISTRGDSFLDQVIHRNTSFIIAALEAGVDPGYVNPEPSAGGRPAVLQWVKRKFIQCDSQSRDLTDQEIEAVDKLMRRPTEQEINVVDSKKFKFTRPILSDLYSFAECDDGGAAFFRYLKDLGADVGIASGMPGHKFGILSLHTDMKPALMEELKTLSPSEIDRLAHPTDPATGERAEPLLAKAMRYKNLPIINFLCSRGIDGCVPAHAGAGADGPWLSKE